MPCSLPLAAGKRDVNPCFFSFLCHLTKAKGDAESESRDTFEQWLRIGCGTSSVSLVILDVETLAVSFVEFQFSSDWQCHFLAPSLA